MTTLVIGFALGILGFGVQSWWAERQKDQRTRRRIARAVIPDLQDVSVAIMGMGCTNKWDSVLMMPATPHWDEHKAALSEAITRPKEWIEISGVFEMVRYFAEEAERHEWPAELSDMDSRALDDLYQDTRHVLRLLSGYAGVPKPPKRVRQMRRRARHRDCTQALRKRLRAIGSLKPV